MRRTRRGSRLTVKMKAFYSNLRIKHKMFALITGVMLLVCASAMAVFQYAFDVYDREIYALSSRTLNLSSLGVESELRKLETLSFQIDTDPLIQAYLFNVKYEGATHYEQYVTSQELRERMVELAGFEKYVSSIQIYDVNGFEYGGGNRPIETPPERVRKIRNASAEGRGGNRWVFPDAFDPTLVAVREVRYFGNLEFERVGMMALRVHLEAIVNDNTRGMDEQGAFFLIVRDGRLVLPDAPGGLPFDPENVAKRIGPRQGYDIVELDDGKRYFMTHVPSNYLPWSYVVLMPYDKLFQATTAVKSIALAIFSGLFLFALAISVRFSKGITGPIESLNAKMKNVQKGNFEYVEEPNAPPFPMDEAGQLHRNFRIMLERINELINENFKKQLAIKESEFKALQSQINPHFLYNTLESINWSAKLSGQRDISTMVESLGSLLRGAISQKQALVPLKEEMAMVGHYIAIQRVRYEERLDFEAAVPPELEDCVVPKMTLQPLVENAIHYGVERMIDPCRIRVRASVEGGRLELTVEDGGPGMDRETMEAWREGTLKTRGSGIGLRNIDERIRLMFGEGYGLTLHSEPGEGARVVVALPCERKEENRGV